MQNTSSIAGTYIAKRDMPIKYTHSLGGGIKGRTVKAGEQITATCVMNDINSQSVSTIETLHRIEYRYFLENFNKIS